MRIRALSFILLSALLLSLLSCAGKASVGDSTVTSENGTELKKESVCFESDSCVGNTMSLGNENEKVTVIRETGMLDAYYALLEETFDALSGVFLQNENNCRLENMVPIAALYDSLHALKRYDNKEFFKENVLLMIDFHAGGGIDEVLVKDVYIKEEGGKKSVVIDAVKVLNKDGFGADAELTYSFFVAIPNDLGVDLDKDVIVNWESVVDTLYLSVWH